MSHLWIFMVIRVASQTKNTNNAGQKNICVICATIKNQREEINQCEIKKPNHYEEQGSMEVRDSNHD